ncbi:hypothetical protein AB0M44_09640 [Streptosporangium subroseum]|uniref:hypothetical protein n=1 Tax=Streptosporangium subroseum TaxID=106412 RepID=UPI00343D382C
MSGRYSHVTEAMLQEVEDLLTGFWEIAIQQRAALSPRSAVPMLDAPLTAYRDKGVISLAGRVARRA